MNAHSTRRLAVRLSQPFHRSLVVTALAIAVAPAPAHGQSTTPPQQPPPRFHWEDHATFRFGPNVRMELRFRIQNDWRDTQGPLPAGESEFRVPLKRFGVRGSIGPSVDYQVDHELVRADGWRDVFANVRWRPELNVRVGQFKLPFSLEETSPTTALDFMYRARAARQLAPGRDPGAMAYGRLAGGAVRYEAGAFIRDGRNARRPNSNRVQGKGTVAGRLRVMPFGRSSGVLRSLDLGVAAITSRLPEGLPALRGRTALDFTFFSSDHLVGGRRQRVGLELAWQPGPFAVKSEYIRTTDDRPATSGIDGRLEGTAWYASAMWVVTGEAKGAGLTSPTRPVHRGGPGIVEVGGRVESLRFRDGSLTAWDTRIGTAGVNWNLNRWVRVQFNLIRERLDRPESQSRFWHRVFRIQFVV